MFTYSVVAEYVTKQAECVFGGEHGRAYRGRPSNGSGFGCQRSYLDGLLYAVGSPRQLERFESSKTCSKNNE